MRVLYPDIKPYQRHRLAVSGGHELYLEESGNPDGVPVLCLFAGPGSSFDSINRRFCDPQQYRIVLFDPRGCGRSKPYAELSNNDLQATVSDIEQIRKFLNIDQWVLLGGSWGSLMALAYGQAYPDRVQTYILQGLFLGRQQDFDWIYKQGVNRFFPDSWEQFLRLIPEDERHDLLGAFYTRLTGSDEIARMAAAKAWSIWGAHCATLRSNPTLIDRCVDLQRVLALAVVQCHFAKHLGFLEPDQLLNDLPKIHKTPAILIHGRYDALSPPDQALHVHKAWPMSELCLVREGGHAASEGAMQDTMVRITDQVIKQLKQDF
jgi:proline iminopeptidase